MELIQQSANLFQNTGGVHNAAMMAFNGRISSEILLKVAKIGCGIVLSKSAPTELALRLANELGITTVGFIRNQSFNVYTWPERIEKEERGKSSGSK